MSRKLLMHLCGSMRGPFQDLLTTKRVTARKGNDSMNYKAKKNIPTTSSRERHPRPPIARRRKHPGVTSFHRFGGAAVLVITVLMLGFMGCARGGTKLVAGGEYQMSGAELKRADEWEQDFPTHGSPSFKCSYWQERQIGLIGEPGSSTLRRWAIAKAREACEPVERQAEQERRRAEAKAQEESQATQLERERLVAERVKAAAEREQQRIATEKRKAEAEKLELEKEVVAFGELTKKVSANSGTYLKRGRPAILSVMRAPSTTQFVSEELSAVCPNGLVVAAYEVDSQNGFGAMIRSSHCAILSETEALADPGCTVSLPPVVAFAILSRKRDIKFWKGLSNACTTMRNIAVLKGMSPR